MKKSLSALVLLLAFALPLQAQNVVLPKEVRGSVGSFIEVKAETKDAYVSWMVLDAGLNMFPVHLLKDTKVAIVTAPAAGRYRVLAVTANGDKPSEFAMATVIVGTPPDPGPVPPVPPGPGPGPMPMPMPPNPGDLGPFGGAVGLHVLVVYESASSLTKGQFAAIYGKDFRDYIEAKAAKGPDGKTPQRRIYDQNVALAGESKLWQDAMARKRASIPWIAVGNGAVWVEGPLPMTVDETISLVKKVGG